METEIYKTKWRQKMNREHNASCIHIAKFAASNYECLWKEILYVEVTRFSYQKFWEDEIVCDVIIIFFFFAKYFINMMKKWKRQNETGRQMTEELREAEDDNKKACSKIFRCFVFCTRVILLSGNNHRPRLAVAADYTSQCWVSESGSRNSRSWHKVQLKKKHIFGCFLFKGDTEYELQSFLTHVSVFFFTERKTKAKSVYILILR